MDKKLIVDIDNIEIKSKKSKVKNSYDDLEKNIELLPKVLKYFKYIHVERLKIDGNEFTISMNDKAIYLDNKFINISSKIDFSSHQVVFDLYSLYLKDIKLMFDGKLKVDYFNEKLDHFGRYYYQDLEGELKLEMTPKIANFYLNSESFKSLKFLKKFFRLSSEAEAWMYDNVKGNLRLEEFYGKVDLVKEKIIEKSLQGKATIDKAKIRFHKDVKTVDTKKINVVYKKDTLSFDLVEPKYDGIDLKGSNVVINNLTSEQQGEVVVNIKANAKLDDRVLEILKAYEINLPLFQKTGLTNADLTLNIPYLLSKEMSTNGLFIVNKADVNINDFSFYTNKANVYLNGSIVKVKDSHFKIDKLLDSKINIDIDTNTLKAKGNALINSFEIKTEEKDIVNFSGIKSALELDFNEDTSIKLNDLNTDIKIADYIYVDISKLSSIYKSSQLLKDLSVKSGNLSLKIKDENDLSFKGKISGLNFPIAKNGKDINSLNINGFIKNDYTKVITKNKDILVEIKDKDLSINLNDLDLIINTKESGNDVIPEMNVSGKNITLRLDDEIYFIVNGNANISDKKLTFEGLLDKLDLPILKDGKKVEKLNISGNLVGDILSINTKDEKIKIKYFGKEKLEIFMDAYDLAFNTSDKSGEDVDEIDLKTKNSNLILNEKYKFLSDTYELRLRKDSKFFHLAHGKTDITFKENKEGKVDIYANDISDKLINSIFGKEIFKGGKLMLLANGDKSKLKGKMILTNVKIDDLAIINNLLLFIHSSPALVNPLLAVPTVVGLASNKGFNLTGYKVSDGVLEFTYDRDANILNIDKLVTLGNGIDFEGSGKVDINTLNLESSVKMIFFKDYSKIVGSIPVVNYVLLGKNKRVSTQVNIFGPLNNPKLSTNLTKDAFSVPLNIGKRILSSPLKLFDFINDSKDKK